MDSVVIVLTDIVSSNNVFTSLQSFMQQGGQVLWWLFAVVVLTWLLIFERIIYLIVQYPKQRTVWVSLWLARDEQDSWYARAIREGWLSQAHTVLYHNLNILKVLVAICPMLGLLGTVTGMITVFDVMASQGSSSPKLMASGISMATLPTMVGMVAALSGMFFHARLVKACQIREIKLEKSLRSQR
ncbi:MotA/TolQ/ExbB proton channel family protein [Vibrio ostreicida]|uniref:MotA/TolQ/ExbB proton channel family protein n=1 Tax=Vibrio ostreicida TaxID=526588 RepID=A0ABT8BSD1_9VIBR|nr:MotA/TolQ/ExbB proton channel family protein [Vibrio ostreicida]MDN3609886.1 MotA/TolQ/ExbB proton channel family protein [Vibrio ostreicida]NPD10006.1 MotA/TolQ/ExbB proton channel family protein [Vibrio ostreicida]